jgi:replicative DNA helicase
MFIYREDRYRQENEEETGIAEIIIGKQRNGPVGTARLAFLNEYTRFENVEWREMPTVATVSVAPHRR